MARKDPYCTCGRPQSDHKDGHGAAVTGCTAFTLTGRGGQLKVLELVRPGGDRNNFAPTYLVQCPRCQKKYETQGYLRDIVIRRSCRDCMKYRRTRNPRPAPGPLDSMKPSRFLHGTRARYVKGCRCKPCKEANTEYSRMRQKSVRMGDTNKLVPVGRVKAHLEKLREVGIGLRSVADVSKISLSVLQEIRRGLKDHTREKTQAAILAVTAAACLSDGHRIDAGPTRRRIEWMLEQGYTKYSIARALGSKAKTPALQLDADTVTARNARLVQKLYDDMQAGRVGSLSAELPVD